MPVTSGSNSSKIASAKPINYLPICLWLIYAPRHSPPVPSLHGPLDEFNARQMATLQNTIQTAIERATALINKCLEALTTQQDSDMIKIQLNSPSIISNLTLSQRQKSSHWIQCQHLRHLPSQIIWCPLMNLNAFTLKILVNLILSRITSITLKAAFNRSLN